MENEEEEVEEEFPQSQQSKKKSQTVLNIVYLNARSIVSKLDDLELLANEKKPALILICESWCNSNINNAFLSIDNYYLEPNLRYDRCEIHNLALEVAFL